MQAQNYHKEDHQGAYRKGVKRIGNNKGKFFPWRPCWKNIDLSLVLEGFLKNQSKKDGIRVWWDMKGGRVWKQMNTR
jgi:hypothetical protein